MSSDHGANGIFAAISNSNSLPINFVSDLQNSSKKTNVIWNPYKSSYPKENTSGFWKDSLAYAYNCLLKIDLSPSLKLRAMALTWKDVALKMVISTSASNWRFDFKAWLKEKLTLSLFCSIANSLAYIICLWQVILQ